MVKEHEDISVAWQQGYYLGGNNLIFCPGWIMYDKLKIFYLVKLGGDCANQVRLLIGPLVTKFVDRYRTLFTAIGSNATEEYVRGSCAKCDREE